MRVLLDTHALLWWHEGSPDLSQRALDAVRDPANTVYLSVVNVWEAQIKHQLGKLTLQSSLREIVRQQHRINGFGLLSVRVDHVYRLDTMPMHHRDPFDRLLVAQALSEDLVLVSKDEKLTPYAATILW